LLHKTETILENNFSELNRDELLDFLNKQEKRIKRIENHLHLKPLIQPSADSQQLPSDSEHINANNSSENLLEYKIGQYWFAKLGIVILLFGLVFLLILPHKNFPTYIPSIFGIIFSIGLSIMANRFSDKFSYICGYLKGGAIILLFFSTLRFHFFSNQPFISSIQITTILLLLSVGISLFLSAKAKSPYLLALSLFEGYIVALLNGNSYFLFLMLSVLSVAIVYLKIRYESSALLIFGIALTYASHFMWFINNPLAGNVTQFRYYPQINTFFVLIYLTIFSSGFIINRKETTEKYIEVLSSALNLLLGYGLLTIISMKSSSFSFTMLHVAASLIFLSSAMILWAKIKSKYFTFLFAMTGYLALSILIVHQFKSPDFFVVLCWQSLIVISTALWFKSKFIILANFFIFISVFILYVILNGKLNSVSISYGIVALLSSRILNWKKERLELKTEIMRDSYLVLALFIIPYALYHSFPEGWIIVSWIIVSLLYYLLSVILKSKKYRWMALANLLFTIVYVFIFGLSSFGTTQKITSFLVLGIVLLAISLFYAKIKGKGLSNNSK